ncbi:DUF6465 family protein [Fusicatenibacter sp.]
MVKKKPAAQAKTAENETVKVETKAAEKTAAEKEVSKEVAKATAAEKVPVKAEKASVKAEEKPAAKAVKTTRTTGKKTSATQKTTEKKAPAKTAKKAIEQEMILQFGGREIKEKDLYEKIRQIWMTGYGKKADELKSLKVYVKPEEFTAYYVINDDVTGSIDL